MVWRDRLFQNDGFAAEPVIIAGQDGGRYSVVLTINTDNKARTFII
jgi:hypothetical protein